jgi:hypothetical protein
VKLANEFADGVTAKNVRDLIDELEHKILALDETAQTTRKDI